MLWAWLWQVHAWRTWVWGSQSLVLSFCSKQPVTSPLFWHIHILLLSLHFCQHLRNYLLFSSNLLEMLNVSKHSSLAWVPSGHRFPFIWLLNTQITSACASFAVPLLWVTRAVNATCTMGVFPCSTSKNVFLSNWDTKVNSWARTTQGFHCWAQGTFCISEIQGNTLLVSSKLS